MTQPNEQENYYKSRVDELSKQLIDMSRRHRRALGDVRRAKITTQLIRKLYRLDFMKLTVDELAGTFIEIVSAALGVSSSIAIRADGRDRVISTGRLGTFT